MTDIIPKHGSMLRYDDGCRCDECTDAYAKHCHKMAERVGRRREEMDEVSDLCAKCPHYVTHALDLSAGPRMGFCTAYMDSIAKGAKGARHCKRRFA